MEVENDKPLQLDDNNGNLDPQIATHVHDSRADVEKVLIEEAYSESFNIDTTNSFEQGMQ